MRIKFKSLFTFIIAIISFVLTLSIVACINVSAYSSQDVETNEVDNTYATGCLPNDGSIPLSFSLIPEKRSNSFNANNIPVSKDLSTYPAFPLIGNQGSYGSCVAYATTYYQFTYEVARQYNWNVKSDTNKVFSPMFVYNFVNSGDLNQGTSIVECYNVLAEFGSVKRYEFNETANSLCEWNGKSKWFEISNNNDTQTARERTIEALNNALENRVVSWNCESFSTQNSNTVVPVITANNSTCIDVIKNSIASNHVLVFRLKNAFSLMYELETQNGISYVRSFRDFGNCGGHALTIVGYNDSIHIDINENGIEEDFEYGAFKVANSWGTSWGMNGYFWMPYDTLNNVSNDTNLNVSDRIAALDKNQFYYIEVDSFEPQLTVEIDVTLKDRADCYIQLNRGLSSNNAHSDTILNGRAVLGVWDSNSLEYIATDFNGNIGNEIEYDTRVFVFDLSNPYYDLKYNSVGSLYDENKNSVYYLKVEDFEEDDNNIVIEKIAWVDENSNVLFKNAPNESFDGESKNYIFGGYVIDISGINMNQDSRRVHINIEFQTAPNTIRIHLGDRVYTLVRQIGSNTVEQIINGDVVKFVRTTQNGTATWDIQIKLSQATMPGIMEEFYIDYKNTKGYVPSCLKTDFVAYKSFVKTGLSEGMTISELIEDINGADDNFTYSIVNGISFTDIDYDFSTRARTGIIVLKKYNGVIAEAYFVIIFGDIAGGGNIGNGLIEIDDALAAIRHVAETGIISDEILLIAADVDHDGDVNQSDADLILSHAAHIPSINQDYSITIVSDELYYINTVAFV